MHNFDLSALKNTSKCHKNKYSVTACILILVYLPGTDSKWKLWLTRCPWLRTLSHPEHLDCLWCLWTTEMKNNNRNKCLSFPVTSYSPTAAPLLSLTLSLTRVTWSILLCLTSINFTCQKRPLGSERVKKTTSLNPFTPNSNLIDFTLSNARRFYSSKGNPVEVKGLSFTV